MQFSNVNTLSERVLALGSRVFWLSLTGSTVLCCLIDQDASKPLLSTGLTQEMSLHD